MDNMEFSQRISKLRRERGLSQKELGDMLGVSNKAVSKWENGESLPKTSTMLKLAELLGIDGNELIGFEVKEKLPESTEMNHLKQENTDLRSQLSTARSNTKRVFIAVVCICIACIITVSVIAVCFESSGKKYNKNIIDAGAESTKIIYDDITFIPADALENYIISTGYYNLSDYGDTKYADYYNTEGDKQKALIYCSKNDSFISIKSDGKEYYYFEQGISSGLAIIPENIYGIDLENSSVADNSHSMYDDPAYIVESYSYYDDDAEQFFREFCDFYNNKPSAADSKITERYLGSSCRTAVITLNEEPYGDFDVYSFEIGEFFKDGNGNVYFYDYVNTTSYPVGKELGAYVY